MCGKAGEKIIAAILAAIGLPILFSAVWEQFYNPALFTTGIVGIFLKYLVGLLFLGAAKMVMKGCWHKEMAAAPAARIPARRRRR